MSLYERERELARLRDLFTDSVDGHGQVVFIEGAVAMGKTTLLRAFAEHAAGAGAVVLDAAGTPALRTCPLALMRRLFRDAEALPAPAGEIARLLDESAGTAAFTEDESPADGALLASALRELSRGFVEMAARTPLVVCVDDVDHCDRASLRCLLYLSFRIRTARVLIVIARRTGPAPEEPFLTELADRPPERRIHLEPLSRRTQARMLVHRFGTRAAIPLVPLCDALTGGNPLLVDALLADDRPPGRPPELTVNAAFTQAVTAVLLRGDPAMSPVARALAIIGEPAYPELLGGLSGLGADHAAQVVDAMNTAGLLDAGRFRHPAVRDALLAGMTPGEQAVLHGRAAHLLHTHGSDPMVVAGHLIAAGRADAPWAVPTLEEFAERALADDEPQLAVSSLRLARTACADARDRARVDGALARTGWRVNPDAVSRFLPGLVSAARAGLLGERPTAELIAHLISRGQANEARELLRDRAGTSARAGEPGAGLAGTGLLLSCFAPGMLPHPDGPPDGPPDGAGRTLRAARMLSAVLTGRSDDTTPGEAERILQGARLGDTPMSYVVAALLALVYDDRAGTAARHCDPLLEEAAGRRAAVWHAVLAAIRGLIAHRQGDLAAAERHARTALTRMSPASWGVAVGMPLAVLVLALTSLGRYEDAAAHLAVAIPGAMFATVAGAHYLQARGRYHLATGNVHAALSDFQECGRLARTWGFDVPGFVSWRTDEAQALARLGHAACAAGLADEQLAMTMRARPSRARGVGLRVRAMVEMSPPERRRLLHEAVRALEAADDRYELALALTDLSDAQRVAGEHAQASAAARDSHRLIGRYGWSRRSVGHTALIRVPAVGARTVRLSGPAPAVDLTEAELRVAALAAEGHTNREIAGTLRITVSTVEQHLTRVYRKLRVHRRADLRPRLRLQPVHTG